MLLFLKSNLASLLVRIAHISSFEISLILLVSKLPDKIYAYYNIRQILKSGFKETIFVKCCRNPILYFPN